MTFSNNHGNASSAIRFTTALPYGSTVDVTPEFINCTFKDHNMPNFAHTSPVTIQRVNLKFEGSNVFQRNYGGNGVGFLAEFKYDLFRYCFTPFLRSVICKNFCAVPEKI